MYNNSNILYHDFLTKEYYMKYYTMLFIVILGVFLGCRGNVDIPGSGSRGSPVILDFAIDSLTHAAHGTDEFSMKANINEATKQIEIFIPDGINRAALETVIKIPQGAQLIDPTGTSHETPHDQAAIVLIVDYTQASVDFRVELGGKSSAYTASLTTGYIPIFDEADFSYVRSNLAKNYILMNDIALTVDFEPIGSGATVNFAGVFNGNYKTISNLKISKSGSDFVGFIGVLNTNSAIIRNLVLELAPGTEQTPSITGRNYVGAVAGATQEGKILQVAVRGGYVKGGSNVGGFVGQNNGSIENSYTTASVSGVGPGNECAGGLIGTDQGLSNVMKSYASGAVSGTTKIGGFIGCAKGAVSTSYFDAGLTGQPAAFGETIQTLDITPYYTNKDGDNYVYEESGYTTKITVASFTDWDFTGTSADGSDDIWRLAEVGTWPKLAWE